MVPPYQEFKRRFIMRDEKAFEQLAVRRPTFRMGRQDFAQVTQDNPHLACSHDRVPATVFLSFI
jgi:hypothetical protein